MKLPSKNIDDDSNAREEIRKCEESNLSHNHSFRTRAQI